MKKPFHISVPKPKPINLGDLCDLCVKYLVLQALSGWVPMPWSSLRMSGAQNPRSEPGSVANLYGLMSEAG
jgi:hypothetical protein